MALVRVICALVLLFRAQLIHSALQSSYGTNENWSGSSVSSIAKQTLESMERLQRPYPSANLDDEALDLGEEVTIVDDTALEIHAVPAKLTSQPPVIKMNNATTIVECSNDSLKQDFGTACLKKSMNAQVSHTPVSKNPKLSVTTTPSNNEPGNSRHFSVKPMIHNQASGGGNDHKLKGAFKSPGMQARELYDSKGYKTGVKGYNNNNNAGQSPGRFYASKPSMVVQHSQIDASRVKQSPEEEEWNGIENIVTTDEQSFKPRPPIASNMNDDYQEELELLTSLEKSLGILSAQATNLKQRAIILYREARRRRLYFFDALLSRTYNYMNEKQDETRNAITDIENTIQQIQQHHQLTGLNNLRKLRYYLGDAYSLKRAKKQTTAPIDRKEIDRLIEDVLKHAQRMMATIKELNEALDEFEEQFNMPRYEPNNIELSADSNEQF